MLGNDIQDFIILSIGGLAFWLLGFVEGMEVGKKYNDKHGDGSKGSDT